MIRHVLLVQFKATAEPRKIEAVRTAFLAIPEAIEGVEAVEWGENNSPEGKHQGYTHCVLMTFADEAARERYLPHPAHEALVAIFRPLLDDIIVVDYSV